MLDATSEITASNDTVFGAHKEEYRRMKAWLDGRIEASKSKPSAEVVTVTPLLARLLLGQNTGNRPISARNAADLASDIANKRFEFNGESIVVAKTGLLIDGQHRCLQVASTGKSIESVIVFGPREQARFTIDTGKSKTVSNFLAMKGKNYTHALGPAVNYLLQWRQHNEIFVSGARGLQRATKIEILDAAEEIVGIEQSVEFTSGSMKTVKSHSVLAACHNTFWKRSSRAAADEFMLKLIEGDGLRKGDPILYCRNRLLAMGSGTRANARAELIIKCWNAWRTGAHLDHYRIVGGKLPKVER